MNEVIVQCFTRRSLKILVKQNKGTYKIFRQFVSYRIIFYNVLRKARKVIPAKFEKKCTSKVHSTVDGHRSIFERLQSAAAPITRRRLKAPSVSPAHPLVD